MRQFKKFKITHYEMYLIKKEEYERTQKQKTRWFENIEETNKLLGLTEDNIPERIESETIYLMKTNWMG